MDKRLTLFIFIHFIVFHSEMFAIKFFEFFGKKLFAGHKKYKTEKYQLKYTIMLSGYRQVVVLRFICRFGCEGAFLCGGWFRVRSIEIARSRNIRNFLPYTLHSWD